MKIVAAHAYCRDLALQKPYTIAHHTFTSVENVFLEITLANGMVGIGAGSPAEEVVGETPAQTLATLKTRVVEPLIGQDIRAFRGIIDGFRNEWGESTPGVDSPGALAALDIALHDAFGQWLGLPVATFYGQKIQSMPTSVTIGIMNVADTLAEARTYIEQGFRVLKIKTGLHVEEDSERIRKLHEQFGHRVRLRVDANQGYNMADLKTFLRANQSVDLELIEQPLPVGEETKLLALPESVRQKLAADESLKEARAALRLAQSPRPFGIFNIKLMKCGGMLAAFDMATIAQQADIDLFWGCNDESIVSITAALHTAFACPNTRYLDLDGSFDLAEDIVTGGFVLENGNLRLNGKPGLGLCRT